MVVSVQVDVFAQVHVHHPQRYWRWHGGSLRRATVDTTYTRNSAPTEVIDALFSGVFAQVARRRRYYPTGVRSGEPLSTLLTPGIPLRPKSSTRYSLVCSLKWLAVDATTTGTGVPLGEGPSTLLTSRYFRAGVPVVFFRTIAASPFGQILSGTCW